MLPTRGRRTWATWLAWSSLALFFLAVSLEKIWAGDFWGQLRAGQWILENGRVPRVDWYTFTRAGTPWIEVRWLWEVAIALGWRAGPWLLSFMQVALLAAMWGVLAWRIRRWMGSPAVLLVLGMGIAAGSGRWVLRPELITDLMVAVFLVCLERIAHHPSTTDAPRVRWSWVLGGLILAQIVWVNSHSVYVLGPILAWAFTAAAVADWLLGRLSERAGASGRSSPISAAARPGLIALAVTAACWVNPYFTDGALYAFEMWRQSRAGNITAETLGELRSPFDIPLGQWTWDLWAGLALAVLVAASFVLNRRRTNSARLLIFLMALYLAAGAQRNVALLAIMGAWAGLRNTAEWQEDRDAAARRTPAMPHALVGIALLALLGAWYTASDRAQIAIGAPREFGAGVLWWDTPIGAADFAVAADLPPQVFNTMRDGHFLGWRSGGRIRTFIDGRTDISGDALMAEYASISPATWDPVAARWGINTAIVQVKGFQPLVGYLARHPGWALVYLDHRNVIFVRRAPEHEALISRYRIDVSEPWRPRTPEPSDAPEGWKSLLGGPGRPWYTQGMAETFLSLGALGNADEYLARTLQEYPNNERARAQHAAILRLAGERAEAERFEAGLGGAWLAYRDELLASWLVEQRRHAEAAEVLERVLSRGGDARGHIVLADQYFQMQEFAKARPHYERAVAMGHSAAPEWLKLGTVHERTGDLRKAAEAYAKAIDLEPGRSHSWNLLGRVLAASGDLQRAAAAFERALQLDPQNEGARQNLEVLQRGR